MPSGSPDSQRRTWAPLTATGLKAALGDSREIYVSGCSAEIPDLGRLLDEAGVGGTVTSIVSPVLNRGSYASAGVGRRARTFFMNRDLRADLAAGLADLCPWTYSRIDRWCATPGRFHAAVVMVSPPDARNRVSLGTQVDFLPSFWGEIPRLIGVVNPQMPRTMGDAEIDLGAFSALFDLDVPLAVSPPAGVGISDEIRGIGERVAGFVPDGATIQMGIGKIPMALARSLSNHRGLTIHAGFADDNILALEDSGALDRDVPITVGVVMGSAQVYDRVDRNPRFAMRAVRYTHDPYVIARHDNFIAMNGAVQIDLFGQLNVEAADGSFLATPGGLPEFVRGAHLSKGGRAISVLRASRGRRARGAIVARMATPGLVAVPRSDVDIVVTEYGAADLRDLSLDGRAEALIGIADPLDRPILAEEWALIRSAGFA